MKSRKIKNTYSDDTGEPLETEDLLSRINIRPYSVEDMPGCEVLAGASTDYPHVVDENADSFVVAEYQDEIIGLAFIQIWPWNRLAWIGDLIVDKRFSRGGLGSELLQRMEEEARERGCRAMMDHPSADHPVISFYLKRGYRICGYNDAFFDDPERSTAIFLTKDLIPRGA